MAETAMASNIIGKLDIARDMLMNDNLIAFTVDVDWASEYAMEKTLELFHEQQIPITVFVTHPSAVIKKYLDAGLIRCGIHPNFMPGSSQGDSYREIVDYCFKLLPGARCFRAHRYYEVNDTMELLYSRGIEFESNLCALLDVVPPFLHRSNIVSFPIFWEDGAYLYYNNYLNFELFENRLLLPGLKVINIHPMHLMLNTPYFSYTREIKDRLSRAEWNGLSEESIAQIAYEGEGIRDFIIRMMKSVKEHRIKTMYLEDIYDWIQSL